MAAALAGLATADLDATSRSTAAVLRALRQDLRAVLGDDLLDVGRQMSQASTEPEVNAARLRPAGGSPA